MHTQHANFSDSNNYNIDNETNMNRKPNFLSIIVMSIIAGFILVSGFFMSMMLLAVSVILLPIVAIKLWFLKRQFESDIEEIKTTTEKNDDTIEAEYVIVDTDEKR